MITFTIKVPNHDDGEDLGTWEAESLPRIGDEIALYHPALTGKSDHPFIATVTTVQWEGIHPTHRFTVASHKPASLSVTVWIEEQGAAAIIYCTCTAEEREHHGRLGDDCANCGRKLP